MVSGFVRAPGEGAAYEFHGARVVMKASGLDTVSQLAVVFWQVTIDANDSPHARNSQDLWIGVPR